ncbi:MAG: DUF2254 domain-containing protein [Rhodobacterales bacterium]|nr:DUF2254 domain-containing protein [Rhodobacterales bacterium]
MSRMRPDNPVAQAIIAFGVLLSISLCLYTGLWWLDFGPDGPSPVALIRQPGTASTLVSFSEATVGLLGIAITVVAIIVELASNRYTPRISELFIRDPINVSMLSIFVVSSVLVLWVNTSLYAPHYPENMALAAAGLMSLSLLALLPYFAYVFDFLSPTRVIQRIRWRGENHVLRLARDHGNIERCRFEVSTAIEQIGDIALNSIEKKDKALTIQSVNALAEFARHHISHKRDLPESWFDGSVLERTDPDFIAFHANIIESVTLRHTWVEMKVLRQYQSLFTQSIHTKRDIAHLLGIQTRRIALFSMDTDDRHVVNLCLRFLNTYMRSAINGRDAATAYNLLNEYRAMAESAAERRQNDLVLQLAEHIKYYGQLAFSAKLGFILESAAYDLCSLLESVSDRNSECHDTLLRVFLDVDRKPDGGTAQEISLRGVRKAQIKLATHYLIRGKEDLARRIYADMKDDNIDKLQSIRKQLLAVETLEFWEVSDRGINFEYLPPDRRAQLNTFFSWFPEL